MNTMQQDRSFVIETVVDEIKTGELGESNSKEELVAEVEGFDSYFSAELSTIQPVDDRRSLLILVVRCHPATKRRFVNATITWKVGIPGGVEGSGGKKPKVTELAPEFSVGGWTKEWDKLVWGVAIPMQVGLMGGSVGVQPSRNREVQKVTNHAMTIVGTKRNLGARCVWTVEENVSSKKGIPSHFQLAIVVEHEGQFETELDLRAELGGGLWTKYLKAKKGGLKRAIDVETWKCGDVIWDENGWESFMKQMTGQVTGAILSFDQ